MLIRISPHIGMMWWKLTDHNIYPEVQDTLPFYESVVLTSI